jgi:hypothetical protein
LNTTAVDPKEEAKRLRKQAMGTPPGIERERLLRKARQIEAAAKWEKSPAQGQWAPQSLTPNRR